MPSCADTRNRLRDSSNLANPLSTSTDSHRAELFGRLYHAGVALIKRGLPILPINGKKPCNAKGHGARRWQRVKYDAMRLEKGLKGAFDPWKYWQRDDRPESEPGIGLRMGPGGCIDVECDSDDEQEAVNYLFRGCGKSQTVSFKSRRGRHDLYLFDDRLPALAKLVDGHGNFRYRTPTGKEVTLRLGIGGKGSQSVIPPSPGREWLPGCSFDDIPLALLPDLVVDRLLHYAAGQNILPKSPPAKRGKHKRSSRIQTCVGCPFTTKKEIKRQLTIPAVQDAINEAILRTVTGKQGTRQQWLGRLARRLVAFPSFKGRARPVGWIARPAMNG